MLIGFIIGFIAGEVMGLVTAAVISGGWDAYREWRQRKHEKEARNRAVNGADRHGGGDLVRDRQHGGGPAGDGVDHVQAGKLCIDPGEAGQKVIDIYNKVLGRG